MAGEGRDASAGRKHSESERIEDGVWRFAHADRASVIIDAADYFARMQEAMLAARKRIFLIGWDFDTRINLINGERGSQGWLDRGYPSRLGSFMSWVVRKHPGLEIRILKWSLSYFQFLLRGSMAWDLLRWARHKRILFKFDSAHPIACSHHQKIAVLDNRLAVCGGIDMTDKRWDTREHLQDEPGRRGMNRRQYAPWHDATMMMEGEIAQALADLGQDRWERAGGPPMPVIEPAAESLWPEKLAVQFEDVEIGIARTRAEFNGCERVSEIRTLFLRHIGAAKRFIYAESQYFASRAVAEAIVARLQETDPPEIVIVHPENADGWLEQQAMDHARAMLVRTLEMADKRDRFSLWVPRSGETSIYVHAKLMIIDDEIIRIGSANLNNRSMGLDSECDVFIDSHRRGNAHAAPAIAALRHSLLAEHLGLQEENVPAELERHGTMRALIEASCELSGRHLLRYRPPPLSDTEKTLAKSELLDPERPEDMFEPFAKGGLFRKGSRLARLRERLRRYRKSPR